MNAAMSVPSVMLAFSRLLTREQAARYVGMSPTTFDTHVAQGKWPAPLKLGGLTRWDVRELDSAIDALSHPLVDADRKWRKKK